MTQPLQPRAVTTPEQQEFLDAESLAYELAAEEAVTAPLEGQVTAANAAIMVMALALVSAGAGIITPAGVAQLRDLIVRLLSAITPSMSGPLADWAVQGVRLGVNQAYNETPGPDDQIPSRSPTRRSSA